MSARTPEAEPLLTPAEVATMFRVAPDTVTRWAKAVSYVNPHAWGAPALPGDRGSCTARGYSAAAFRVHLALGAWPGGRHVHVVDHAYGGSRPEGWGISPGGRGRFRASDLDGVLILAQAALAALGLVRIESGHRA